MMIPHHQGAIEMTHVKPAKGEDPELKALAQDIINAQQREISQMRAPRRHRVLRRHAPRRSAAPDIPAEAHAGRGATPPGGVVPRAARMGLGSGRTPRAR